MKKLYFAYVIVIFVSSLKGQIVNMQWAKNIGGPSDDVGKSITTDVLGNVYTTGYFQGTVDFDPGPGSYTLSSAGLNDIFISKLNSTGNLIWAKSIGGSGNDNGLSIKVDGLGNVYTTGFYSGTADFNPGAPIVNLVSVGFEDVFVSKLDASGNFVWAQSMGGADGDISNALALDASGNVYTTGVFQGTSDFNPGPGTFTISGSLNGDIFVSKLDAAGAFVWAKNFSGTVGDFGNSITVDGSGNVFTTGYYSATVDFNPGGGVFNLTANGNQDVFISKLDASGNFVWAQSVGGVNNDYGNSISFDSFGNVYASGAFDGSADFDPGIGTTTLTSNGSTDVFILKLSSSGALVWAKNFGGPGSDFGNSIAIDVSNNILSTGTFAGTSDFDPGIVTNTISALGLTDVYISKLDDQGNFVWAKAFGGLNNDISNSISIDALNNVYTTGEFNGLVDFDPNAGIFNLTGIGGQDIFVHKLSQCVVPAAPLNISNVTNQTICDGNSATLNAAASGTVNWFSSPTSTNALSSGTVYISPTLTIGSYTYYAEASTCTVSASRTAFTITVNANPTVSAVSNMSVICAGESATLTASGASTYTWSSGGNSTTEVVTPSVSINYTVMGTDNNGCSNASVVSQSVNACVGMVEQLLFESQINIFPNPSNGILNVELGVVNGATQMQLTNMFGQILIDEMLQTLHSSFNVKHLNTGIYFVRLTQNKLSKTFKVIIN